MKLVVGVDRKRGRLGWLIGISEDTRLLGPAEICATADEALASSAGNAECDPLRPCGHVPFGSYRLKDIQKMSSGFQDEYGTHALVFEPLSGEALHAESYGRLVLALYGGHLGEDGRLRTTDGGLRVDNTMLNHLVTLASHERDVRLEVKESPLRFWEWLFGRRRRPSRKRSRPPAEEYDSSQADEISWRRPTEGERTLKGPGGTFSGAGASGGWKESAPGETPTSTAENQAARGMAASGAAAVLLNKTRTTESPGESTEPVAESESFSIGTEAIDTRESSGTEGGGTVEAATSY